MKKLETSKKDPEEFTFSCGSTMTFRTQYRSHLLTELVRLRAMTVDETALGLVSRVGGWVCLPLVGACLLALLAGGAASCLRSYTTKAHPLVALRSPTRSRAHIRRSGFCVLERGRTADWPFARMRCASSPPMARWFRSTG